MTQWRRMSLVEAATSLIIGYALAVGAKIVVVPVFDIHVALGDHLAIALAFTGVSLVSAHVLRRLFANAGADRSCLSRGFFLVAPCNLARRWAFG